MTLNGYSDILNGYNSTIANGELPDANDIKAVVPPIGSIIAWLKTYSSADSGTTSSLSAGHLVEAGQNFLTTCKVGMIVKNTTDSTFSYITSVNSNTDLTLNDDIMANLENYTIYNTPYLPDGWVECNGQVLSDASSPYNGATIPDLNTTQRMIRGNTSSGATGGADTHVHQWLTASDFTGGDAAGGSNNNCVSLDSYLSDGASAKVVSGASDTAFTSAVSSLSAYYEAVFIMRVK